MVSFGIQLLALLIYHGGDPEEQKHVAEMFSMSLDRLFPFGSGFEHVDELVDVELVWLCSPRSAFTC